MISAEVSSPVDVARAVLGWWTTSDVRIARDTLPWRHAADPWAVLVSEVMLGQTQASRVAERYEPLLRRFPTPAAMAASPLRDVLVAWSGLGYPRRARALHLTAAAIVATHGGEVPRDLDALLALPGVGPYTARAVLALAFGEAVMPVDTNIARVLARAVAGTPLRPAAAQSIADEMATTMAGRAQVLAVMDLGATRCRPVPKCGECPLGAGLGPHQCRWRAQVAAAEAVTSATGRTGAPRPAVPDPASGSFGVSRRQARLAGSDREGRGRLLGAAAVGPIRSGDLAAHAGWPNDPDRAERAAAGLVRDGLLEPSPGGYRLPLGPTPGSAAPPES